MNKSELITAFAEQTGLVPAESSEIINDFFYAVRKTLCAGERVEIRGFGSFCMHEYAPYMGRNPKSGETVAVARKKLPFFKPGKELKDLLNE